MTHITNAIMGPWGPINFQGVELNELEIVLGGSSIKKVGCFQVSKHVEQHYAKAPMDESLTRRDTACH